MLDLWSARKWIQAFVQITSSAPPLNLDDFPNKHFFQLYVYTFKISQKPSVILGSKGLSFDLQNWFYKVACCYSI